jgi:hypothetical protein
MAPSRIIPLGVGAALVAAALSGCGDSPDEPLVLVSPESPGTNDTLRIQYAERTGIRYTVAWTVDGEPVEDLTTEVPPELTERDQVWRVEVTPIDVESGERYEPGIAEVTIDNAAPFGIVTLKPAQARAGVDLVATPGFTDPDGDDVGLVFSWSRNGEDAGIDDPVVPGDQLVKGDTWEVTVAGNDGFLESEPVIAQTTVSNSPPSIAGARLSPNPVFANSTLECIGVGFQDPDGDPEGYQVLWNVNGVEVSNADTLTPDLFERGDRVGCLLTPTDGEDLGTPVASQTYEVGNAVPTADAVVIDQAAPNRNEPITFTAQNAVDPDGDDVQFEVWWLVNGRGVSEEVQLTPDLFRRGDEVSVQVTLTDGRETGTTFTADPVTVVNAPPVVEDVALNVLVVYTDSVLEPRPTLFDADGDPVTLTWGWTVNGTAVAEPGPMLAGDGTFERGDTVAYTIVPNDGLEDGETFTSGALPVINKPPSEPELAFTPEPTVPDAPLVCGLAVESVDADGDPLTYTFTWDLDGAAYLGLADTTTYADDTIPEAQTALEEEYACNVTVSDGTDTVGPVTISSVIRPEDLQYVIEDSSGLPTTSTRCTEDGEDGYHATFSWFRDGITYEWDDIYKQNPDTVTFRWRQGFSTTGNGFRDIYLNGSYAGYVNLGIARSDSCDSGRTYALTISGVRSVWNTGGVNSVEFEPPCCSTVTFGAFWDEDYGYGRLDLP